MDIPAKTVKELRTKSGAGMMACKAALVEAEGDLDKAYEVLRKKDEVMAGKKAGRVAAEGLVHSYIHPGGRIGVLVEINCETDFAAKSEVFQLLVKDVAMHIAATDPRYLDRDAVLAEIIEAEREIYRAQAVGAGKPAAAIDKIVDNKVEKFYTDNCLYEQAWVRDPSKTIRSLVEETTARTGENVVIRRFERYQLGEAAEVAKTSDEEQAD